MIKHGAMGLEKGGFLPMASSADGDRKTARGDKEALGKTSCRSPPVSATSNADGGNVARDPSAQVDPRVGEVVRAVPTRAHHVPVEPDPDGPALRAVIRRLPGPQPRPRPAVLALLARG